jgi:CDP-glucose 4,6-dehydratase
MSLHFWNGKRVVVTGHTGFKGSWLTLWLNSLGAKVTGISLPARTDPSLFVLANVHNHCESLYCDVRDGMALQTVLKCADPEIVFHMAAQSLVREGYIHPVDTFATNIMGTVQVLEPLTRLQSARVALMVTTDKVYQNKEWFWPYRKDDALGGDDPYRLARRLARL